MVTVDGGGTTVEKGGWQVCGSRYAGITGPEGALMTGRHVIACGLTGWTAESGTMLTSFSGCGVGI